MCSESAARLAAGLALAIVSVLPRPGGGRAAEPPAPDYTRREAWAAWPGRTSGADVVPPGVAGDALPENEKADVLYIHPTTYLSGAAANARYDEPGLTTRRIDRGVLRFQASAFNACCRIYAPHYRQAALSAFLRNQGPGATAAYELAYADVRRAFEYYLDYESHGRAFLIAGHSQGALHASRLLQELVAGRPLQSRLVAAYVVGYDVPQEIERTGLPVCRTPSATDCLVDWNTVSRGSTDEGAARGASPGSRVAISRSAAVRSCA